MTSGDAARIAPWISVPDATAAVDFYARALGAEQREVLRDDDSGQVVVALLAVGAAEFWVQDDPDLPAPRGDGRPVRMILVVGDPDTVFDSACRAGAEEINPIGEENGWRVGRMADPFGNHWEIGRRL